MADENECPVCAGERPVMWLVTHFNPVVTMRSCEEDFEAALLALLATRLEVEPGWLSEVIDSAVDLVNRPIEETPPLETLAKPKPKPKPRKKAAAAVAVVADDEDPKGRAWEAAHEDDWAGDDE
jgi:hypothetical protein